MNRAKRLGLYATFCGIAASCDLAAEPELVCPDVVSNAIELYVHDARTGEPTAFGALGVVRDGPYVDTLQVTGLAAIEEWETASMLTGATGRPGTYDVTVEKPGYRKWERSGVRAAAGDCGVRTVRLNANLEPELP